MEIFNFRMRTCVPVTSLKEAQDILSRLTARRRDTTVGSRNACELISRSDLLRFVICLSYFIVIN